MDNRLFINNSLNINSATLRLRNNINVSRKLILRSPSIYIEPPPLESVQVTTLNVTNIEGYTAIGGGNVISGGSTVMRGICWSTSSNPTISDSSLQYPTYGEGVYYLNISGLNSSTNYYVRAWAYNAESFDYGDNVQFYTPEIFTACTTYQPFFPNIYEETGFLNCDDVSLTSGTLGEYVIDWRNGSTNGEIVFVSGSSFAADPSVQAIHPIENEIVFGATLYPVIRSIYINSIQYSSYNISGARYSPDLRDCLDAINVEAINCDTSLGSDVNYPYSLTYNNVTDYGQNKSRTLKYDICTSSGIPVQYLAWSFTGYTVPEQLKIYYCTSSNSAGTLIDNFIHGGSATTSLYPSNYPDGSARYVPHTYKGTYGLRYISRFDSIEYNDGDYVKIEIIGSVYDPNNNNTNWDLKLKSIYESEISCELPWDASIHKINYAIDPSMVWNGGTNCRYEITYTTYGTPTTPSKNSISSPWLWRYTDLHATNTHNPAGGLINPVKISMRRTTNGTNSWIWSGSGLYTCVSCAGNGSITLSYDPGADVSTLLITCTSDDDYNAYVSNIQSIKADPDYTTWESLTSEDTRYYGYYQIYGFNASTCGDTQPNYQLLVSLLSDVSWDPTSRVISFTLPIPTIHSSIIDLSTASCNETYSIVNSVVNSMLIVKNNTYNTIPITTNVRAQSPVSALWPTTSSLYETTRETWYTYYIYDALLNNICDISSYGFLYDASNMMPNYPRSWSLFNFADRGTITDASDPINNWKLERRTFLRTENTADIAYETVWEVSRGAVIYP